MWSLSMSAAMHVLLFIISSCRPIISGQCWPLAWAWPVISKTCQLLSLDRSTCSLAYNHLPAYMLFFKGKESPGLTTWTYANNCQYSYCISTAACLINYDRIKIKSNGSSRNDFHQYWPGWWWWSLWLFPLMYPSTSMMDDDWSISSYACKHRIDATTVSACVMNGACGAAGQGS